MPALTRLPIPVLREVEQHRAVRGEVVTCHLAYFSATPFRLPFPALSSLHSKRERLLRMLCSGTRGWCPDLARHSCLSLMWFVVVLVTLGGLHSRNQGSAPPPAAGGHLRNHGRDLLLFVSPLPCANRRITVICGPVSSTGFQTSQQEELRLVYVHIRAVTC